MRRIAGIVLALFLWPTIAVSASIAGTASSDLEKQVEALFNPSPDALLVKLAVDAMVEPSTNPDRIRQELDDLTAVLQPMLAGATGSHAKLKVLRRFLYEPGDWNGNRPFAYDMADPLGSKLSNKLLGRYLETRRGNCVTMPMLVMILGRRIGLDMTLAVAPHHVFVKFTDELGKVWNLEATSGAGYTRDIWYRKNLPMTDHSVAKGTYMRALNDDQVKAVMATYLVEHFMAEKQPEQAIAAADVILRHHPGDAIMHVWRGSAFGLMLRRDVVARYFDLGALPPEIRAYADALYMHNIADFQKAEALGWTEQDGETQ